MTTDIKIDNRKKLKEPHLTFLRHQLSRLQIKPTELAERLNNPVYAEEHGFDLVKISYQAVQRYIKSIPKMEMAQLQAVYLTDFSDTPLANKKIRIIELIKIYLDIENGKMTRTIKAKDGTDKEIDLTPAAKAAFKMSVLKQIHDEAGEDVDKMAEALRGISVSHQYNIFNLDGSGNGADRQKLDRNLETIFGPTGNGSSNSNRTNSSRL